MTPQTRSRIGNAIRREKVREVCGFWVESRRAAHALPPCDGLRVPVSRVRWKWQDN